MAARAWTRGPPRAKRAGRNRAAPKPGEHPHLGNLTQKGTTTTTYRTDRPHLIQAVGTSNTYTYDPNANVEHRSGPSIPGGTQDIVYTPFDLPKQITTAQGTSEEKITLFEYTADEERLIRRDPDVTRHFVTDLYQRVVNTGTATTTEERFLLYAGSRQLGEIVRKNGSDETLYFHPDHLGSVELISNDEGETLEQTFDTFGALTSSAVTRSGYTGHQHEADLGLIDMRGRMYDPLGGRFLSSDPVMQAPFWSQGLNPYSYVFNDPINATDPSGFVSFNDVMAKVVGGLVIGAHVAAGAIIGGQYGGGSGAISAGIGGGYGVGSGVRAGAGMYDMTRPPGTSLFDPGSGALAQNAGDPGSTGTTASGNLSNEVPAQVSPEVAQDVGGEIAMAMIPGGPIVRAIIWAEKLARAGNWVRRAGQAARGLWKAKPVTKQLFRGALSPAALKPTHGPTLSPKEFAGLKESIAKEGIKKPINFVEHEGQRFVVDGHHRLRAAKQLGLREVPVEEVTLPFRGYNSIADLGYVP
jgi:RHS repeat-associated protein